MEPNPTQSEPPAVGEQGAAGAFGAPRTPGSVAALGLVAFALAGAAALLLVLTRYEYGLDQGIYAVVGDTMLSGGAPYKDAWDFKTPGVFFAYAASRLFGDGMQAVRILEACLWASLVGAFALLGRRFAAGFAPGLFAGALAVSSYVWLGFWHTGQPEGFGAVALVWALWCATSEVAPETPRLRLRWAGAGALYTVAALMKPPLGGGFLVSLGFAVHASRRAGLGVWPPLLSFAVGGLVVLGSLGSYIGAKGALPDLYGALFVYTPEYTRLTHADGNLAGKFARAVATLFVRFSWLHPVGLLLFVLLPKAAPRERELALHVGCIVLLLLFGVALQGQFFAYHYGATLPLVALLAGFGLWKLTKLGERFALGTLAAALLVFGLANANGLRGANPGGFVERARLVDTGRAHNAPQRHVADWVALHTEPGDTIYVWGFQPMLYVMADRTPASRFIYNSPQRAAWYRERGRDQLMAELASSAPAAVLVESEDIHPASTGNGLDSATELERFPRLAELLATGYDTGTKVGRFRIHLRRRP